MYETKNRKCVLAREENEFCWVVCARHCVLVECPSNRMTNASVLPQDGEFFGRRAPNSMGKRESFWDVLLSPRTMGVVVERLRTSVSLPLGRVSDLETDCCVGRSDGQPASPRHLRGCGDVFLKSRVRYALHTHHLGSPRKCTSEQ